MADPTHSEATFASRPRLALQRIESIAADEETEYEDAVSRIWKIAFDALKEPDAQEAALRRIADLLGSDHEAGLAQDAGDALAIARVTLEGGKE